MLAHLKAKKKDNMPPEGEDTVKAPPAASESSVSVAARSVPIFEEENCAQALTCDVLCSLGTSSPQSCNAGSGDNFLNASANGNDNKGRKSNKACPKQHQLPMFLSSE